MKVKKNLKFRETRWTLEAVAIDDHPLKARRYLGMGRGSWELTGRQTAVW